MAGLMTKADQSAFWRALGPFPNLEEAEARGLLRAVVLASGVFDSFFDLAPFQAALGDWSEASSLVQREPPELVRQGQGWAMRAYSLSGSHGRGSQCRFLARNLECGSLQRVSPKP